MIAISIAAMIVMFGSSCSNREKRIVRDRILPGSRLYVEFKNVPGKIKLSFKDDSGAPEYVLYDGVPTHKNSEFFFPKNDEGKFVEVELEFDKRQTAISVLSVRYFEVPIERGHIDPADSSSTPPNIIIYLVDALRADRLGVYGYKKPTSPNIDAFASKAAVYTNAFAPATWTRASVASLFTGRYQTAPGGTTRDDVFNSKLPTLAEELKKNGYYTLGVVSNGNVAPELGFGRGFDDYVYLPENPEGRDVYSSSAEVVDLALKKIEAVADKPFFAYIHVTDPHAPYTPPPEFAKMFIPPDAVETSSSMETFQKFIWRNPEATDAQVAYLSGLYDGEVAVADREFGRFIEGLKDIYHSKWDLFPRDIPGRSTIIILLSDHGEEFFEHRGLGHGNTLYNETARIPFIKGYLGHNFRGKGEIVTRPVNLVDVMPMLLKGMEFEIPPDIGGIPYKDIYGLEYRVQYLYEKLDKVEKESFVWLPFKLIRNVNRTNQWGEPVLEYEFYNIVEDPSETNDVSEKNKIAFETMKEKLAEARKNSVVENGETGSKTITPELKARLRSLGY